MNTEITSHARTKAKYVYGKKTSLFTTSPSRRDAPEMVFRLIAIQEKGIDRWVGVEKDEKDEEPAIEEVLTRWRRDEER